MIEQGQLCQSCRKRSDAGEFRAGRSRMIDGLEEDRRPYWTRKGSGRLYVLHLSRLRRTVDADRGCQRRPLSEPPPHALSARPPGADSRVESGQTANQSMLFRTWISIVSSGLRSKTD